MITRFIVAALALVLVMPIAVVHAGEHPEHPQEGTQLPDRGKGSGQTQMREVNKADISTGIKKHIATESKKLPDRKFHTKYQGKDLAMDLIKVHDDRVSNLGGGKYFACVDMKAIDGTVYDIDFFLTGNPGNMTVTQTAVHKINGKPLYNWKEQGGVWIKVKA